MTKVISLSNLAYKEMKALKHLDESFSDVVLRLIHKPNKPSLLDLFGKWPGSNEEAINIKKILEKERKQIKTREVNF